MLFLYFMSFILITIYIVSEMKKIKFFSSYTIAIFSIAFLYLLIPFVLFILGDEYASGTKWGIYVVKNICTTTSEERFDILLLVWFAVLGLIIPHYIKFTRKNNFRRRFSGNIVNMTMVIKKDIYFVCRKWFLFLFILGTIGILGMIANIGLNGFIIYSGSGRGEGAMTVTSGSIFAYASILAKFLPASLVPGIMIYEVKKTRKTKFILSVTLFFSILLELYISGKTSFILFALPLIVYLLTRQKQFKFRYIIIMGCLVVGGVPILDNVFYYITYGDSLGKYRTTWNSSKYIFSFVRQFMYPYANLVDREIMNDLYGLRWGLDYIVPFVNLIPASFLGGFQIESLYNITTGFYQNLLNYSTGGVPNDILFLNYRQLGSVGVFIFAIISGMFVKIIDKAVIRLKNISKSIGVNMFCLLTASCISSILFTLIEPASAINSMPMIVCAVLLTIHLDYKLRKYSI